MTGKVEGVKRIRTVDVDNGIDECIITIGLDSIYAYYRYNNLLEFNGKDVDYVTRVDIINGVKQQVLCDIGEISHIQTIEATENVKLYTKDNKRPYCNFSLRTLKLGEYYPKSVAYMSSYVEGASEYAHWFDCNCLDRDSKTFVLRIFAPAEYEGTDYRKRMEEMCGSYIEFDLRLTRFGYQTNDIRKLDWKGGEVSPEVFLAREILEKELNNDVPLRDFLNKFDYMGVITSKMDGEPGYQLVRMASELYFINTLDSISGDINIASMKRAVFCSRLFLLAKTNQYSRSVFNVCRVLRSNVLKDDKELIHILDVLSEEPPSATKVLYVRVRQMVDTVIQIRRGEKYEKDFVDSSINIVSQFSGLL